VCSDCLKFTPKFLFVVVNIFSVLDNDDDNDSNNNNNNDMTFDEAQTVKDAIYGVDVRMFV
jgi:hypothetical protein